MASQKVASVVPTDSFRLDGKEYNIFINYEFRMKLSEYAVIITSLIVVIGWFINSTINRRHEKAKRRMEYRLDMLESFIPVFLSISSSAKPFLYDKSLNEKLRSCRVKFQLYGYKDEIDLFEAFVDAIEKNDPKKLTSIINKLISLVRERLRTELLLPSVQLEQK